MKIYAVVSTAHSWMSGGYGVSLLAAEHRDLLVPFEEFSKKPGQQLRPLGMPTPGTYAPNVAKPSGQPLLQGAKPCDLDMECEKYGVCYAEAHGKPELCGRL